MPSLTSVPCPPCGPPVPAPTCSTPYPVTSITPAPLPADDRLSYLLVYDGCHGNVASRLCMGLEGGAGVGCRRTHICWTSSTPQSVVGLARHISAVILPRQALLLTLPSNLVYFIRGGGGGGGARGSNCRRAGKGPVKRLFLSSPNV